MRIKTVKRSLTALKCSKCGIDIRPSRDEKQTAPHPKTGKTATRIVRVLGDSYRWIQFRGSAKRVRCMAAACAFRRDDLTTSDKLSRVYNAQGEGDDDASELKSALENLASELREVAGEYTDSADAMESAFTGGSPTIDDCREKADGLESWADNIEGVDFDPYDEDNDAEAESDGHDPADARAGWVEEQRDKASEAADDCPV